MKYITLKAGNILTDFDEDSRKKLMDAMNSGEDFIAEWECDEIVTGSRHKVDIARVERDRDKILVEVCSYMDDYWQSNDLIYAALEESCGTSESLPDSVINQIREDGIGFMDDHTELKECLEPDASFDELVCRLDILEQYTMIDNTSLYNELCYIVYCNYKDMKGA